MRFITTLALILLPVGLLAEEVELKVTPLGQASSIGGQFQISLIRTDGSTVFQSDDTCYHLAAIESSGAIWLQDSKIVKVPSSHQLGISITSGFPFDLHLLRGEAEFCIDAKKILNPTTPNIPLGDEYMSQLGNLVVSNGCTFLGVNDDQIHRPGQPEVTCE